MIPMNSQKSLIGGAILSMLIVSCNGGGGPGPQPTPTPEPTPTPWECPLEMPRCDLVEPPQQCSSAESPCWHNPTQNPEHCEEAPKCEEPPPPELPEPQCQTFTDRGGTFRPQSQECDCYFGQTWVPCEEPDACGFPQGAPNSDFTMTTNPGTYGSVVNSAMAELTGCAVGTDCPITFGPDPWMQLVCDKLCDMGLNCGRHVDTPPGATDQISVIKGSFCDGKAHENYQIYNYGGEKVRWAPGGQQDGWILDPNSTVCAGGPTPTPTPPPPSGDCPPPHPNTEYGKINAKEHNGILDTTLVFVNSCDYCAAIGMPCMPGTGPEPPCTPRCGCPIRQEGDPERAPCEAEICGQKWECNGQPYPPYRGNPAQSDCRGHWKTWCEHAPNIVSEGNR